MTIDRQSDTEANLQIGPTSVGMVRIYIESRGVELPMDFDPDEADEIAEELRASAAQARKQSSRKGGKSGGSKKGEKARR